MKRLLLTICVGIISIVAGVQIAAAASVEHMEIEDGGRVILKIITQPETRIAIKVQNRDKTIIGALDEKKANENGSVTFDFVMPAVATSGEYTLAYCEGENDAEYYPFDFADITEFIKSLNNANTPEELASLLKSESPMWYDAVVTGFDMDTYAALGEATQLQLLKCYLDIRSGASKTEHLRAFQQSMAIQIVDNDAEKALTLYNPVFENAGFNELTDTTERKWISDNLKVAEKTPAGLEKAYAQACVVYRLRAAKSIEVGTIIKNYGELLGITAASSEYSDYNAMSVSEQGKVHDQIVREMANVKNAQEVIAAFTKAVSAVKADRTPNGGGGGATSGSGRKREIIHEVVIETGESYGGEQGALFQDLSGYGWATSAINKLADAGIISGYGDGNFRPGQAVTREEFVKMAVCAAGLYDENAVCDFEDVDSDQWYYRYVASGVKSGAINGVGENVFGLGELITRQDMAVIVCRLAEKKGIDLKKKRDYANYSDDKEIAEYAKTSIGRLYCAGFINGVETNRFAPLENTTRAQAAKILYDVFYNYGG